MIAIFILSMFVSFVAGTLFTNGKASQASDKQQITPKASVRMNGSFVWLVNDVQEGGPAALAGLGPSDIILRVNGKEFDSVGQFYELFTQAPTSTVVNFQVLRQEADGHHLYNLAVQMVAPKQ